MQDFSKKIVIIVRSDIETWRLLNTACHIAAYFGKQAHATFDTGDFFETKDGRLHPRNSQYPIVIVEGKEEDLRTLLAEKDTHTALSYMPFTKAMIESNDDNDLAVLYKKTLSSDLELLGLGIFGDKDLLKTITKKLSLYK